MAATVTLSSQTRLQMRTLEAEFLPLYWGIRGQGLKRRRALEGKGGTIEDATAEGDGIGIFDLVSYTDT